MAMLKPRILFMGTPDFALPALRLLHEQNYPIIGVVTQPDRPKGRGLKEVAPPIKMLARELGLPVFQPEKIKDHSFFDTLKKLNPDMIVVVSFGQILPKAVIDYPPLNCLNIHPSLLPKYRGAAPINWAIINGEQKTGVTIMLMDEGMDSGDILLQEEIDIGQSETFGELHERLAHEGAKLLLVAIDQVMNGTVKRTPQNSALVTFAPRLKKETGKIDWRNNALDIVNLIRGLNPSPAAYTYLNGQPLKIFKAEFLPEKINQIPGTIVAITAAGLAVAALDGCVVLKDVQLAGRKRMPVSDFLRGYKLKAGSVLH